MNNEYDAIEQELRDKTHLIRLVEKLKAKFFKRYNKEVGKCSDFNDHITNQHIRNVSHEFADFLAEIDVELKESDFYRNPLLPDNEAMRLVKNKIVEHIIPIDQYRGKPEYSLWCKRCSMLSDTLEDFFTLAYNLGRGRKEISKEEIDDIDKHWHDKCNNELNVAYNEGCDRLMFMLAAACSDEKVMKELKDRKIL